MEEYEDLEKINKVISKHKFDTQDSDAIEFAEFIDYDCNPNDTDDDEFVEEFEVSNSTRTDVTKFSTYAPSQFFTTTEKGFIDSCTDPLLKEVLVLNRTKNIQLMQVYRNIKDLLIECQASIMEYEEKIKSCKQSKKIFARVWRLGIPYFKTADDFPCPRNADIVKKHQRGEMFFYDMTPSIKWPQRDINRLLEGISFYYKINKQLEIEKLIMESEESWQPNHDEIIQELKNKLEDLRNSDEVPCYPPRKCDEFVDWSRISERFLNERYSEQDCQVFWNIYLHPDINKHPWTVEENEKLKSLVLANNCQNWDRISEELGGNRTGFIACVHYYCKINTPRHGGRFTPEEDKQLCDLVEKYRQGDYIPWAKISQHFSKRTRAQLFYRHRYFLSCRQTTHKGKFSRAEDILLMVLVDRFGKKFVKCGEYFPNRSVVQIKARYTTNLKGAIKKGSFTIDEDETILEYVLKRGTRNWEPLVKKLSRSGAQIRQRYNTLVTFQSINPDLGLDSAPRRRYSGDPFRDEYEYVRLMADRFKTYENIPTLEDIQRLLESNPKPKPKRLTPLSKSKESPRRRSLRSRRANLPSLNEEDLVTEVIDAETISKKSQSRRTGKSRKRVLPLCGDSDNEESTLPSIAIDDIITDFYSNSMKLRFEKNVKEELVIHTATSALNHILSTLQAELYIPKDFKEHPRLDAIDLEILDILVKDKPITMDDEYLIKGDDSAIERMIPPNLNTVVCMRGLLTKNHIYKVRCAKRVHIFSDFKKEVMENQVLWCINKHLSHLPADVRYQIILERNMFFKRFVSCFKFPAIMSLVEPSNHLRTSANQLLTHAVRTYQKRPKVNPSATQSNPTSPPPFDTVFINESNDMDCKFEMTSGLVSNNPQATHFSISNGNHNEITITRIKATSSNSVKITEPVQTKTAKRVTSNLSIAEELKRKINQEIQELSESPSTKTFFHPNIEIIKQEYPDESITPYAEETDYTGTNNIAAVIENDVPKIKKKRLNTKETAVERVQPVSQIVNSSSQPRIRTYVSRTKRNKTNNTSTPQPDSSNRMQIIENVVFVKSERTFDSCPEKTQSSFNFGKGEFVLEHDSPNDNTTATCQDLRDLKLLDEILRKEKSTSDKLFNF